MYNQNEEFKIDINKIPKQVLYVLNQIEQVGYDAYLTGGATRDILLNKEPQDYDITTSCPLEILQSLFSDCKVVGAEFGVALIKVDHLLIQIARFRTEQGYSDYRHPDTVYFTNDIMEDLQRRDFVINTFSVNNKGNLIYVDGALDDLKNGIIRAVGNPVERFSEDPLRMLRAARFHCQLCFGLEFGTMKAICDLHHLIKSISMERIQEELNKILVSNYPINGIIVLYNLGLLNHIIQELIECAFCEQNTYHKYDVFDHICLVVNLIPNDLSLRLTALFHDIGKTKTKTIDENNNIHFYEHEKVSANMAEQIMIRLKYDNKMIEEVKYLVLHHMELMDAPFNSNKAIRKLLNKHGESRLRKLIEIRRADLLGSGTRKSIEVENLIKEYKYRLEEVLKEKPATKFEDLAINGNDIMRICCLKPCETVGIIKEALMEWVLQYPQLNIYDKLDKIAWRYYNNDNQEDIKDYIESKLL